MDAAWSIDGATSWMSCSATGLSRSSASPAVRADVVDAGIGLLAAAHVQVPALLAFEAPARQFAGGGVPFLHVHHREGGFKGDVVVEAALGRCGRRLRE